MSENQTLEEEEIVHENECLHFEIKNPVLKVLFYTICGAAMLSLPVLANL